MSKPFPRKLKSVDVYPFSEGAVVKEFSLWCSPVFELYSAGLAGQGGMPAWAAWSRIVVNSGTGSLDIAPPPNGRDGDFESATVGIGGLGSADSISSRDYLDWLHSIMISFAQERGYDRSYLDQAYGYCLEVGLEVHLVSALKRSPNHAHRAQLSLDIGSDGERTTKLQIWNKAGDRVGAMTARDRVLVYGHRYFNRLRRRIRWSSNTAVGSNDAYDDMPGLSLFSIEATVGEFREGSMLDGYRQRQRR